MWVPFFSDATFLMDCQDQHGWYQHDSRGAPVGSGCKVHMCVLMIGYADRPSEEVANQYHSDKGFKAEVDAASGIMLHLIGSDKLPLILPQSTVTTERSYTVTTSWKMAFITESDLSKLFGAGPRQLKMGKPTSIRLEDGSGWVSGWYMSLTGIPAHISAGLRKVKVSTHLQLQHADHLLTAACQVRKDQAMAVANMALSQQQRPTAERASGH